MEFVYDLLHSRRVSVFIQTLESELATDTEIMTCCVC